MSFLYIARLNGGVPTRKAIQLPAALLERVVRKVNGRFRARTTLERSFCACSTSVACQVRPSSASEERNRCAAAAIEGQSSIEMYLQRVNARSETALLLLGASRISLAGTRWF